MQFRLETCRHYSMTIKTKGTFQFKKFSVRHDRCTHKVGTDGVLLGAWADIQQVNRILDIGTGSGVIALMLAQRSQPSAVVDGIDLSIADCEQALENIKASPWPDKVHIKHTAVQTFESDPYDLIVSNPPYFIDSTKPPTEERLRARHTETLTPQEILHHAKRLLAPQGKLSLVLPVVEALRFIDLATEQRWYCSRLCEFSARIHKPIERVLFQLQLQGSELKKESLVLYEHGDVWTEDYTKLTQDFYLAR